MLPEGWEHAKLGELLDFQNGVNTEAANYGRGTKFVNVMDIFENRYLTQERIRGAVAVSPRQDDAYALRRGDILFNRTSETFDEIALSSVYLDDAHAIFGGFVIRGRPKNRKLLPEFSCYCFSSDAVRREMVRRGQGAIRANIGQGDLGDVPLLLPPLPEQKKITDILSTWDNAIETTEKLLANAEKQKRALMQQLLTGKRQLSSFKGREWKQVKFSDVVRLSKVRLDPTSEHEPLPCIELEHIEAGTGRLLGTVSSNQQASIKAAFLPGDVLFGKLRPYLRKFYAPSFHGVCSTEIWVLKPDRTKLTTGFLSALVQSDAFLAEANRSSGSKMPRADWKVVSAFCFPLPDTDEQKAIADAIGALETKVGQLQRQLELLETEKRALMQQLLTGKRRVTV